MVSKYVFIAMFEDSINENGGSIAKRKRAEDLYERYTGYTGMSLEDAYAFFLDVKKKKTSF